MRELKNYNCVRNSCCRLNQRNSNYSVYGLAKGNKTNYKLVNSNKLVVSQYVVDDCVLKDLEKGKKCDFLFEVEVGTEKVTDGYFVEMKGDDIDYACGQIINSIKELGENIKGNIFARIVQTKNTVPDFSQGTNYKRLKRYLGNNFLYKNKFFEDVV